MMLNGPQQLGHACHFSKRDKIKSNTYHNFVLIVFTKIIL